MSVEDTQCSKFFLSVILNKKNILELKISHFTSFNTKTTLFQPMTTRRRSVLWIYFIHKNINLKTKHTG